MAEKQDQRKTGAEKIRFNSSDGVPVRFADAFLVGGSAEVFFLNFFQNELPPLEGTIKEFKAERTEATCFARVAISPGAFKNLVYNMASHVGLIVTEPTAKDEA
jgi:hypothetical protein